jgi:hypothetical protein
MIPSLASIPPSFQTFWDVYFTQTGGSVIAGEFLSFIHSILSIGNQTTVQFTEPDIFPRIFAFQ